MAWIKAFHVVFVLIWMGSLFSVSHLLGLYRKESAEVQERLCKILFRMYHIIELPCMLIAVTLGLILISGVDLTYKPGWFHMKLTFLLCLIGADLYCGRVIMSLQQKERPMPSKMVRAVHGIAGLCLIGVMLSLYVVRDRDGEFLHRIALEEAKVLKNSLAEMDLSRKIAP